MLAEEKGLEKAFHLHKSWDVSSVDTVLLVCTYQAKCGKDGAGWKRPPAMVSFPRLPSCRFHNQSVADERRLCFMTISFGAVVLRYTTKETSCRSSRFLCVPTCPSLTLLRSLRYQLLLYDLPRRQKEGDLI
jgi:hypothetical protein